MPFINEEIEPCHLITIDRDRDITLTRRGSGPEPVYPFYLHWHGTDVKFSGEREKDRYQNEEGKWRFNYDWNILSVFIPQDFPESQDVVFQVIKEALDAYGEYYSRTRVGTVKVGFSENALTDEWYDD
ncbi:MAG: hypothetical protein ACRBDL_07995 [Alphaproteobacteria bacterium]